MRQRALRAREDALLGVMINLSDIKCWKHSIGVFSSVELSVKQAQAVAAPSRLDDVDRLWAAKLLRLHSNLEIASISLDDERRLIRLFRTATRVLPPS